MWTLRPRTSHSNFYSAAPLGNQAVSKDWLTQCQDNVTEWDSRLRCLLPGVRESHECAPSQVGTHPDMTLKTNKPTTMT